MLHPSYTDLMEVVNSEVGENDTPVVNSRYRSCWLQQREAQRDD